MRAILLIVLLVVGRAAVAAPDYAALNADAVNRHILPRYEALAAATGRLETAAREFCGGSKELAPLQRQWRETMAAWQAVQHLRFGPAEWFNRAARFSFWPDPRNVTTRQLAELFQKRDPKPLAAENLVTASVAIQGLSAVERVLFDEQEARKLSAEPYRCDWLVAVAANLAAMGQDIRADWTAPPQDYAKAFVAANGGVAYRTPSEATLDLFKSLYAAVEIVADHKLARPLGESAKNARPRLAESWRSGASLDNIAANLAAARALWDVLSKGVSDVAVADEIARRFDAAGTALAAVSGPLEEAVGDSARRASVEQLRRNLLALKRLLAERVTVALDLPLGFNALDGD